MNLTEGIVMNLRNLINQKTLCLAAIFCPTFAVCEDDPEFIILGPAQIAEYSGSEDYKTVPLLVTQFSWGEWDLKWEGLTGHMYFSEHNNWQWGLATQLDMGRDDEIQYKPVANMESIDPAVNLGGILAYETDNLWLQEDSFRIEWSGFTDINSVHDGYFSTLNFAYALPLMIPWRFEFEIESTYGNSGYMNHYFGVNTDNRGDSNLPDYIAGNSLQDVSFITNVGLFFNPRWGVFTRLGVTQFLGDAKKSPLIKTGDDKNYFIGVGVFYRFGE